MLKTRSRGAGVQLLYKKEKGATSVLVILMLVVLVALGSFAITSANVNIKFSNNAIEWVERYYELDSSGENFLMDCDAALSIAEGKAVDYILNKDYERLTHQDLPIEFHSILHYGLDVAQDMDIYLNESLNKVYLYYAEKELEAVLKEKYPEAITSSLKNGEVVTAIISEVNFTASDKPDSHLNIILNVNTLEYEFTDIDGDIVAQRRSSLRYRISSWREWQNPVELETEIQLWDGELSDDFELPFAD